MVSWEIKDGVGSVVLTTVNHLNAYVFDLTLTNKGGHSEKIGVTGYHKMYSAARGWVSAEQLRIGERLATANGTAIVDHLERRSGTHRVYNFTVEREHVFYVSSLAALGHNQNCTPRGGTYTLRDPETGDVMRSGRTNDLLRRAAEHARDYDYEFRVEQMTDDYVERRGLEQLLHDEYHPPLDRINGISPNNPRWQEYMDAAWRHLGQLR